MQHKINNKCHFELLGVWEAMFDEEWTNPDEVCLENRLLTICVIHHIPTHKVYTGAAVFNPADVYDQLKGRKVAFGYALDCLVASKHYGKNKALRTIFWDALLPQL